MIVRAPAKINLTLEILGRRDDGYHNLRSVMVPIALYDEIDIVPGQRFSFTCEPASLGDDNLAVRALAQAGKPAPDASITLRKRIPVGAGLGGGSSDAAAMLRTVMDGAFGAAAQRDWIADARAIGSDVPFFLAGTAALIEGTGERVTALGGVPPWWIVLLVPGVHVDTPAAYRMLAADRLIHPAPTRPRNESASIRMGEAVQRTDYSAAIDALTNDFEPLIAAAYPQVTEALAALRSAGAQNAMLSGSGGATFALCEREAEARALIASLIPPAGALVEAVPFAAESAWRVPAA